MFIKSLSKLFLLLFCNLISWNLVSAQLGFSKIYYNNNGFNQAWSFVELKDSGFILAGERTIAGQGVHSLIMRTDKYGDSIWTKTLALGELADIVKKDDSTFLVCGIIDTNTSMLGIQILTVNINGDTSLFRDYGYLPPGGANGIEKTADNGFIVKSGQSYDYEFLKLDSSLNEQWHYNIFNMQEGCTKIKPDPNGGYVAIGSGWASQKPYVVSRFDSAGIQIWQQVYGNQPLSNTDIWQAHDVIFLPDSNFIVCTDGLDWQLMKINRLTADTLWTKNYYDTAFINVGYELYSMDTAGNNRHIIANNAYYGHIMLVNDTNGDTIWTKPRPWINMRIRKIKKTADGGFAMCGYYYVNPTTFYLAFAKIDSLGNAVFTSVFNPENNFQSVSFYPNPASNEINISLGSMANEKNLLFTLTDLQGRSALQQQYNASQPVDVSTLPEGLYIATLKGKEKEVRGKVMVQR